ncbi:RsmB/NOP family class I SAM-dependent RNA methyltransferase [Sulfitobacter sp. MF3-043]|uniref:RsmB/NOP family class I SAM-dependent RNA methyltransferase n=1 Tax=Sulfitobacter sediminivivens TaxID=3252902 RepID=UPI0036D88425
MTPGARVAAAIEVLDDMAGGLAAEQALTRWARRSRFAGSKDRAAIRDHVFDVLRTRKTAAYYGGSDNARALMIGLLHHQGADIASLFDALGHAPSPLSEAEADFPDPPTDPQILWNLPDWMIPLFQTSLGNDAAAAALALQSRAPITLRVNLAKTTRAKAQEMLREQGIETTDNPLANSALTVTQGARKIRNSAAYSDGYVELQDAASQAVVAALTRGGKVLDYCTGGGGKALALAMDKSRQVFAHDIDTSRMADLPTRTARAAAGVIQVETDDLSTHAPYDVVLCDAPCSGSGAWRRAAEGKWTLTPDRLQSLTQIQDDILDKAATLTALYGILAYATCSVFKSENEDRVDAFLARNPGWQTVFSHRYAVDDHGDGFFTAHLTRA